MKIGGVFFVTTILPLLAVSFVYEQSDQPLNWYTTIAAYENNQEIGLITFKQNKNDRTLAEIDRIEVDKAYRNKQLGRQLVLLSYNYLQQQGVKKITWYAQPDPDYSLDRLIRFYEQTGAHVVQRYEDAVLMQINF